MANLPYLFMQAARWAFHAIWISTIACVIVAPLTGLYIFEIAPYVIGLSAVLTSIVATLMALPNLPDVRVAKSANIDENIDESSNESGSTDLQRKLEILKQFDSRR